MNKWMKWVQEESSCSFMFCAHTQPSINDRIDIFSFHICYTYILCNSYLSYCKTFFSGQSHYLSVRIPYCFCFRSVQSSRGSRLLRRTLQSADQSHPHQRSQETADIMDSLEQVDLYIKGDSISILCINVTWFEAPAS